MFVLTLEPLFFIIYLALAVSLITFRNFLKYFFGRCVYSIKFAPKVWWILFTTWWSSCEISADVCVTLAGVDVASISCWLNVVFVDALPALSCDWLMSIDWLIVLQWEWCPLLLLVECELREHFSSSNRKQSWGQRNTELVDLSPPIKEPKKIWITSYTIHQYYLLLYKK